MARMPFPPKSAAPKPPGKPARAGGGKAPPPFAAAKAGPKKPNPFAAPKSPMGAGAAGPGNAMMGKGFKKGGRAC